jgi:hypothetical protein
VTYTLTLLCRLFFCHLSDNLDVTSRVLVVPAGGVAFRRQSFNFIQQSSLSMRTFKHSHCTEPGKGAIVERPGGTCFQPPEYRGVMLFDCEQFAATENFRAWQERGCPDVSSDELGTDTGWWSPQSGFTFGSSNKCNRIHLHSVPTSSAPRQPANERP